MAWPLRHLPVIQNWDCHGCGQCCQEYEVTVTDAERERINKQGWDADPDLAGVPLFVSVGTRRRPRHRLNTKPDNTCIFLNADGRCRIHAKFGSTAKPLACQIYPYVLIPSGDHWRIGIRYACPSAVDNLGRPLKANIDELRYFARSLEEREGIAERNPLPPPLQARQHAPWADIERFTGAVLSLLSRPDSPLEYRLRLVFALAGLCRKAHFDKISGTRLSEFLELVSQGLVGDVEADPERVPHPDWVGRILFRQAAALYARRDTGPRAGVSSRGRLALLWAAWRFACGTGAVPRVHGMMPEATFDALEQPAGPMPAGSEEMLGRYFRVKIESHQFFGPTNFQLSYWDGLDGLLLTFPIIAWLSRAFADRPREDAFDMAVRIVDDNFGHNRLLGLSRQKLATRLIASRGELPKLIAWYGR